MNRIILVVIFYFTIFNSVISQNTLADSLHKLLSSILDEKLNHDFIKTIVIGNKGCNLQSATSISHDGQFKEIKIPYPKGTILERLKCENCIIDSSNVSFNVLKIFSKEMSFGITNDCKIDNVSLKLNTDSIYTITNIGRNYKTFDELEEIKGFGSTEFYTTAYISLWLHPSYEFISIKENVENADFNYTNKNEIVIKAINIKDLAFEIKYRRKKTDIKVTTQDIHVKGDFKLKIYDDKLEDGDVVNIYIDDKLILENYEAKKRPKTILIKTKSFNQIRIENVNEGKIPPNTVTVEIIDQEKANKLNVKTGKLESYQINVIQD
jgi:hypothetical protein